LVVEEGRGQGIGAFAMHCKLSSVFLRLVIQEKTYIMKMLIILKGDLLTINVGE